MELSMENSIIGSLLEPQSKKNLHEILECPYTKTNLVLIVITGIVLLVLKIMMKILEPINYELDMTTKRFCKTIAEIDNSLRFKRGASGEFQANRAFKSDKQVLVDNESNLLNLHESSSFVNDHNADDNLLAHTGSSNHVYPNGWIPLIESYKVAAGSVKKAIIMGRDVIVTRSIDGSQVNVLDAYCPHMGVHLGIGGSVRQVDSESCVECPFHGWTFRASDGQCIRIPYLKSDNKCGIPKQAKLGTWNCVEVDNFIYIWHHIDDQPPSWSLSPTELLRLQDWTLIGRSCHKINLELRDVLENGADMNHFESIHNDLFVLGGNITRLRPLRYLQEYIRHHWRPDWRQVLNEFGKITHMAEMKLQSWISFFSLRLFDITVRATQIGPTKVNLYYNSKWYGKGVLIMNAVPLGGRKTKYIQHIYSQRTLFQCFMAKWVFYGEIKMLERDLFIWNHKKNIANPIFIPEDKTLKQFRLWHSQFYRRKRKISISATESKEANNNIESLLSKTTCKEMIDF